MILRRACFACLLQTVLARCIYRYRELRRLDPTSFSCAFLCQARLAHEAHSRDAAVPRFPPRVSVALSLAAQLLPIGQPFAKLAFKTAFGGVVILRALNH